MRILSLGFLLVCLLTTGIAKAVPPVTTVGNQVLFGGAQGSLAGNSLFWSQWGSAYYNRNIVAWLKDDWNATIIRAAMGVEDAGGYISKPQFNEDLVTQVVNAAIAEDIYVIIDWHSHDAEDYQSQAIDFFSRMAQRYGSNNNVIFEIYNEPDYAGDSGQFTDWQTIKDYAIPVIQAIRNTGAENLIVVGTPVWSQDVDIASQSPITGFDNIAYTLHFYAGTHTGDLRDKAQTALNNGIPLFVTEWGTVSANGDGAVAEFETNQWMAFLRNNTISHLNWAINDKAEGSSVLIGNEQGDNNQGGWVDNLLTPSGLLVKQIIQDWEQADLTEEDDNNPKINTTKNSLTPMVDLILREDQR